MVHLKAYRLRALRTQEDLARDLRAVEPRLTPNDISRYETGLCLPTLPQLRALETALSASRLDLYDRQDLDLLAPDKPRDTSSRRVLRKCFRMDKAFASTLPEDLLSACGYSSWQSWYDAAIKRLLGEYAARKKAASRASDTRDSSAKTNTHMIPQTEEKVNAFAER